MRRDGRLSRMLHVLIHMHLRGGRATSETIAAMLGTNPVVVRRSMAGLREAGYVSSEGGHGGGWRTKVELEDITVLDIHRALRGPALFAIESAADHPKCPVEKAAKAALDAALQDAENLFLERLGAMTLADVAGDLLKHRETARAMPSASQARATPSSAEVAETAPRAARGPRKGRRR